MHYYFKHGLFDCIFVMKQQRTKLSRIEEKPQGRVQGQLDEECDVLTAILDSVETLIVVLDSNGRILRFNRSCERLTGYSGDEVEGSLFGEQFLLPEEQSRVQAGFAQLVASRVPYNDDYYWVTRNGRSRLITSSNAIISDAAGEVQYIIITGKDITEHKQTSMLLTAGKSLRRVTAALLQHLTTLDDVLNLVCREALQLTKATGSALLLLEDENWLRVTNSSGTPSPILERLPIGESFAGLVMGQGKPLLLNDPTSEMQAYSRNPDLETLLAVPLSADNRILGALDVVNKPGGFTEEDIQLLQLFADQAAIAIEYGQLHQQSEILTVVEERQRLARELHDSVTQSIYSVNLYAEAARMALSADKPDVAVNNLQELRNMTREAMFDMRMLIFELHEPEWEEEGLVSALQARLDAVEGRAGLQTEFHARGGKRLSIFIEEELYRIAQELLTNAVKHAKAQKVIIRLIAEEDCFCLEVQDDGLGFNLTKAEKSGGLGLQSIKERVQRINGMLTISSFPGEGTTAKVEVKI